MLDAAIIGSGVVGLAVAERLAARGLDIVVLESHSRYGVETSSRNSEVVHAGIYYPPDSLKSRLCHEGRRKLYALAKDTGIFIRKTGKLIVATDGAETANLEELRARGERSGAEGLEIIDGPEARRRVPFIRAEAALWSPASGVLDSEELMGHYYGRALDRGAIFMFNSPVSAAKKAQGGYSLIFGKQREEVSARAVVNAAGLHADRIAELVGLDVDAAGYRIHWCKGSYFRYRGELKLPHLVYPVPRKHSLGIHLTLDREGRIRLGPDAEFTDKLDYDVPESGRKKFHEAAARYWPGLLERDLAPDTAGIRPKLVGPEGGFRDFVIAEESGRGFPGWINLIGIESPGLTASPAIAEMVDGMV